MGKAEDQLSAAEKSGMVRFAGMHFQDKNGRADRAATERLLQTLRTDFYIYDDRADEHVRTLRRVGFGITDWLRLSLSLLRLAPAAWEELGGAHAKDAPLKDVPKAIEDVEAVSAEPQAVESADDNDELGT